MYGAAIMKLIVTIVADVDADKVMAALTDQHIGVTRVSSTGGLLTSGDTTLLIGVDEPLVPQVMAMIAELAPRRQSLVPYAYSGGTPFDGYAEVQVGGFLTYVLDIDHFEQV